MGSIRDLPRWKGMPVPWVALWSGERPNLSNVQSTEAFGPIGGNMWHAITFANAIRDDQNILWQPVGLDRSGEPLFGEINTHRAAACIKHVRCQVCGSKINDERLYVLMVELEAQLMEAGDRPTTTTPPVCSDCIIASERYCPALRAGHRLATVKELRPIGVFGEWFRVGQVRGDRFDVGFGDPLLEAGIAKQYICQPIDLKWED